MREYTVDGHTFTWDEAKHLVTVTDKARVNVGHFYTSEGDDYPAVLDLADEWLGEAVETLAAQRYSEQTWALGPRTSMPHGIRKYRPGFETLPVDNVIRRRYIDAARAEMSA